MKINLEYYKIFYYVAAERSITGAARKLAISQPAVSQAIKQLERGVGVDLFVRQPKGVTLTKAGNLLYSYVENGYGTILEGEEELAKLIKNDQEELRIAANDITLQLYLLTYLERFRERYPEIKVSVLNASDEQAMEYLERDMIDFAIVIQPFQVSEKYRVVNIRKIQDLFVAGKHYEELKDVKLDYKKLQEFPYLGLEEKTSSRIYIDTYLEMQNVKLAPEFELATNDMVVQFAMRNMGIGCVIEDFAREQIEKGELFSLQFENRIPKRDMCLVINSSHVSSAMNKLLQMLEIKQ